MKPMYESLADKLKTTSALKWFPGHGAEESWIAEVEEELGFSLQSSSVLSMVAGSLRKCPAEWWEYSNDLFSGTQRV